MQVHFVTPTRISLIDITSMGDSSKRGITTAIGQFDSGLKYAIALLLRHGVNMRISVHGGTEERDSYEEPFTDYISFGTYAHVDDVKDRTKELITVHVERSFHGGEPMSQYDMREPSLPVFTEHKTGFALALGYNWELWMALREIWSNILDEGGHVTTDYKDIAEGTIITLDFDIDSEFGDVWFRKHLYINDSEPVYELSESVSVLPNPEGYLRIYKQNILVYQNEERPSRFAYNIKFGSIDERRILVNPHDIECCIGSAILNTKCLDYLRAIITPDIEFKENEYLTGYTSYGNASDVIHNIATEVYKEHGSVTSYNWLITSVKRRKDCKIGGKIIQSIQDHLFTHSKSVTVETPPVEFAEPPIVVEDIKYIDPFAAEIQKIYNFDLDVQVKKASLKGSKVIADKYQKCIIIDDSFDILEDMPEFIVQYVDLTQDGSLIKNLSAYICNLIKK